MLRRQLGIVALIILISIAVIGFGYLFLGSEGAQPKESVEDKCRGADLDLRKARLDQENSRLVFEAVNTGKTNFKILRNTIIYKDSNQTFRQDMPMKPDARIGFNYSIRSGEIEEIITSTSCGVSARLEGSEIRT